MTSQVRKLEAEADAEVREERVLLTGFLFLACSASFVTDPRTTSPGVILPTIGGASPNNQQRRKLR